MSSALWPPAVQAWTLHKTVLFYIYAAHHCNTMARSEMPLSPSSLMHDVCTACIPLNLSHPLSTHFPALNCPHRRRLLAPLCHPSLTRQQPPPTWATNGPSWPTSPPPVSRTLCTASPSICTCPGWNEAGSLVVQRTQLPRRWPGCETPCRSASRLRCCGWWATCGGTYLSGTTIQRTGFQSYLGRISQRWVVGWW